MAKKKQSSLTRMFLEMVLIIGAVVWLSTLLWQQVKPGPTVSLPPVTDPVESSSESAPLPPAPTEFTIPEDASGEEAIRLYAEHNGLKVEDYALDIPGYPEKLYEAYEKSPEARDFILRAPLEYGKTHTVDMSEFQNTEGVPLFMQWDDRWGYTKYAYGLGGVTGCGPTCLAMVAYYYTRDPEMSPDNMMRFAEENHYIGVEGGTEWILFSQGGKKLGLDVKEVPLDKNVLMRKLEAGIPVVCHVGPCLFTTTGHYIVLTGCKDGKILVNDPNSVSLSQRGCTYEEIEEAIHNMWAITKAEE